jgi:hypothetical protein
MCDTHSREVIFCIRKVKPAPLLDVLMYDAVKKGDNVSIYVNRDQSGAD